MQKLVNATRSDCSTLNACFVGVRVKSDMAALSFGKTEDVFMYRAAGGVLKVNK